MAIRTKKKRIVLITLGLLLAIPFALVMWLYLAKPGSGRLQAAIAATDQLDPHWRLEDLESHRQKIDDERNSALVAMKAFQLLPKAWGGAPSAEERAEDEGALDGNQLLSELNELGPEFQLNDRQRKATARLVRSGQAALPEARKLADLPQGRYPRQYERISLLTRLDDVQNLRTVSRLLQTDAIDRALKGDIDGALISCLAMINAGRSIGDDPLMVAQLVRAGCVGSGLSTVQRVLGLGQPSGDEPLARLEALLADEAEQPLNLHAIRGERAALNDLLTKLASGEVRLEEVTGSIGASIPNLSVLPIGVVYRNSNAAILEWLNEASLIARKPKHQQAEEWKRLNAQIVAVKSTHMGSIQNLFAFLLMPAVEGASKASLRHHAQIGCVRLMIAMERRRLQDPAKSWPDQPQSALVPSLLASWPHDAFIDAPLQIERTADGWRIWSVGQGKAPNGVSPEPRLNVIFRLIDPDKRGRPPSSPET